MNDLRKKIGLVSNAIPPDTLGQAVMLYRLFEKIPKEKYCLIGAGVTTRKVKVGTELPGKYYRLKWKFQITNRIPNIGPLKIFYDILLWFFYLFLLIFSTIIRTVQIYKIAKQEGVEILIGCTSDLINVPATFFASKMLHIPFIPYLFDDFAYQFTGVRRYFSKWLDSIIMKRSRQIIVTNEFMQKELIERYNVKRSTIVRNPTIIPDVKELDKEKRLFSEEEINLMFTGSIYSAHFDAFKNLVDAIEIVNNPKIKLHLFTFTSKKQMNKMGITSKAIVYHKPVKDTKVTSVTRQADILFLPLAFHSPFPEVIRTSSPGKTGDYLAVRKPILVHAPCDAFVSWFFTNRKCGSVVCENNAEKLAKNLSELITKKKLREEITQNAEKTVFEEFTAKKNSMILIEMLNEISD